MYFLGANIFLYNTVVMVFIIFVVLGMMVLRKGGERRVTDVKEVIGEGGAP